MVRFFIYLVRMSRREPASRRVRSAAKRWDNTGSPKF